jgi:hypothetical protein
MPLEFKSVELAFEGGLSEDIAPQHVPDSGMSIVRNVTRDKQGAFKIRKGFGIIQTADLPDTLGTGATHNISAYNDTVVGLDEDENFFIYDPAEGERRLVDRFLGPVPSTYNIASATTDVATYFADANSDYLFVTHWGEGTTYFSVYVTIIDKATKTVVEGSRLLANGDGLGSHQLPIGVYVVGAYVVVLVWSFGAGLTGYRRSLSSALSATSWTTLTLAGHGFGVGFVPLAAKSNNGTQLIMVGDSPAAGAPTRLNTYTVSTDTFGAGVDVADALVPVAVSAYISTAGTRVRVIYTGLNGATYDIRLYEYNDPLLTVGYAPTSAPWVSLATAQGAIISTMGTSTFIATTSPTEPTMEWAFYSSAGAQLYLGTFSAVRMRFASEPFTMAGRYYMWVKYSPYAASAATDLQDSLVLVDMRYDESSTIPVKVDLVPEIASVPDPRTAYNSAVSPVAILSDDKAYCIYGRTDSSSHQTEIRLCELDWRHPNRGKLVQLGDAAFVVGGVLGYFDGTRLFEAGFISYPCITASSDIGGGFLTTAAVHTHTVVTSYLDARNMLHVSPPGLPKSTTITTALNAGQIRLTVQYQPLTRRQRYGNGYKPHVRFDVYRTQAAPAVTFLQVMEASESPTSNLLTTDAFTFDDTRLDTAINDNAAIYTDGGPLAGFMPPPMVDIAVHQDRVWGIASDLTTLWYSTKYEPGLAPRFNEVFTWGVYDDGRALTALCSHEAGLIVFKRRGVYLVRGDGLDGSGGSSSLSEPERLSAEVGCVDTRSVVKTPVGIFFQSEQGLYLLDRGLTLSFVGKDVRDQLVNNPYISCACSVSDRDEVWFGNNSTVASVADGAGQILVYNWRRGRWSTHVLADPTDGGADYSPITAMSYSDGAVFLGQRVASLDGGAFLREGVGTFPGDYMSGTGNEIQMVVETAWIHVGGLQGYERLRRLYFLGEYNSTCDLTIEVAYDYSGSYTTSYTFSAATLAASVVRDNVRVQVRLVPRQKCQAFRVRVTITPDRSVQGWGIKPVGLRMEVGVKQGSYKNLPSAAKG